MMLGMKAINAPRRRDLRDAKSVRCHRECDNKDEPEYQAADYGCWGVVCLCPIEELLYAALLHPAVEAYALQYPADYGLQNLGHDVADDEYDDRAYELWQVRQERTQCGL